MAEALRRGDRPDVVEACETVIGRSYVVEPDRQTGERAALENAQSLCAKTWDEWLGPRG